MSAATTVSARKQCLMAAAAVAGVALFAWTVYSVGPTVLGAQLRALAPALSFILVLAGARFLLQAAGWRLAMPADRRPALVETFAAVVAGEAAGYFAWGRADELVLIDQSQLRQRQRELHPSHEQSFTRLPLELLNGLPQIPAHDLRVPIDPLQGARHNVLLCRVDRPGEGFHPIRSRSCSRRRPPRRLHH